MKRILFVSSVLSAFILFNSCDTPLKEYNSKNGDEKQIIALLSEYETARNSSDLAKLQSTFHKDGTYISEAPPSTFSSHLTRDWAGEINASDIQNSDPEWWNCSGKFVLSDPEIKISGNEALITMNTKCGKSKRMYSKYTLAKSDGNWLIMKVVQ
jgi:hypothetical protein